MPSTPEKIKQYRSIGHQLKPVVIVNDLSEGVLAEVARALRDHELVKIRINTEDRDEKKALVETLCTELGAELVQLIGKVALILKPAREPNPRLSNLERFKNLLD